MSSLGVFLLDLGSAFVFIGTIPQIISVIKNRDSLRGYNRYGSLCVCIAMFLYFISGLLLQSWVTVGTSITTFTYWLLATIYSWRNK